jgi:Recombinase
MANLYGIDSEDVCRVTIDGLLEMTRRAEKAMDQEKISAMRSRLETYYGKGNTQTTRDQMSSVERRFFWPAVREAYVKAPNLASPATWLEGLYDVASSLRYYRPKEKRDA